jgi:two-component system response regulator RegA
MEHAMEQGRREGTSQFSSLVIADAAPGYRDQLARELTRRAFDVWIAEDVCAVVHLVRTRQPSAVALELKLRDGTWRDVLDGCQGLSRSRFVILTSQGSIATAVAAIKQGATNFLTKPVTVEQLLWAWDPSVAMLANNLATSPLSLDRAIWELLWQTVEYSGSIAGAARMLRLDRRSLRRMLQKNPPIY